MYARLLMAVVSGHGSTPLKSNDYGATWDYQSAAGTCQWSSAVVFADGSRLAIADVDGLVYTSSDDGTTWLGEAALGSSPRKFVALSSSGGKLIVINSDGSISKINY